MNKPSAPKTPPGRSVLPSEQHAQIALREAAVLMVPIVRWLVRHGVAYPAFADMLKAVFVSVAGQELAEGGARPTHSALSVLSGVHRKDVRTLADAAAAPPPVRALRSVPLASQVFTRWLAEDSYRAADGAPRALPRSGPAPSFESLTRAQSTDVHPRTVLEELVRLGLVHLDGEMVVPQSGAFVPAAGLAEMTTLFSTSVADHVAAAVHNLTVDAPKFLEQSVFADGLTDASVRVLSQLAREEWVKAFAGMVTQAQARVERDTDDDAADQRMRFGVYFYSEPMPTPIGSGGGDDGAAPSGAASPIQE